MGHINVYFEINEIKTRLNNNIYTCEQPNNQHMLRIIVTAKTTKNMIIML